MTIIIVIINPQTRNGTEEWMTSCPEEMVLRMWGFWKRVSWGWTIESSSLGIGHWVEELSFSDLYRQRWIEILNTTRCAERWSWVSIVWFQKTFKNCVSLLVSKNRTQEVKKPVRTWTTEYRQYYIVWFACSIQHIYLFIYKQDLSLNNTQWLICH